MSNATNARGIQALKNDKARLKDAPEPGASGNGKGRGAANPMQVLRGTIKLVFTFYPVMLVIMIATIALAAILTSLPSVFMQRAIDVIGRYWQAGNWNAAVRELVPIVLQLIGVYAVAIGCNVAQTQLAAVITQGTLMQVRNKMFDHM